MDRETSLSILNTVRRRVSEKAADATQPFAAAVQEMANRQLRADAMKDVRNVGLAALGLGVGFRGLSGLVNLVRQRPKKTRSGPAELPLPYPVEPEQAPESVLGKAGAFVPSVSGADATAKPGIPWYGPAMMFTGLAGLAGGWKGMDYLLSRRQEAERKRELDEARGEFHDALLSQYDGTLPGAPGSASAKVRPKLKAAADGEDCPSCGVSMERGEDGVCNSCGKDWPEVSASDMAKVGAELDRLYDEFSAGLEKAANVADYTGGTLGAYGVYAGLSGLMTGALVYDKIRKRSRAAVIENALKKRERRRFMQSPPEIYATPEPIEALPRQTPDENVELLKAAASAARLAK